MIDKVPFKAIISLSVAVAPSLKTTTSKRYQWHSITRTWKLGNLINFSTNRSQSTHTELYA